MHELPGREVITNSRPGDHFWIQDPLEAGTYPPGQPPSGCWVVFTLEGSITANQSTVNVTAVLHVQHCPIFLWTRRLSEPAGIAHEPGQFSLVADTRDPC